MSLATRGLRHGIGQYRYPHSYQLEGSVFTLTVEGGARVELAFLDRSRMTRTDADGGAELSVYECLPVAADVYFVSFEVGNRFAVLDLAAGRAVLIDADAGSHLIGMIEGFGGAAAGETPADDADMSGTTVAWVLGDGKEVRQRFLAPGTVQQSWSPRHDRAHDCAAIEIPLGRGLYVVDVRGFAGPRLDVPQGLGRLILVQDYERMTAVGAVLSTVFNERVLLSGYGRFLDEE